MEEKNKIMTGLTLEDFAETEQKTPVAGEETAVLDDKANAAVSDVEVSEQTVNEESAEADNQEALPNRYVPQFADVADPSVYAQPAAVKVKKKSVVIPSVIIAACIFLAAIICGVVFLLFFNTSIAGTYVIETAETPEVQTYFIFEEDGKLTEKAGSIELEGTYEITTENNVSKLTIEIPANYINTTYNYTLEGNRITGMKILLSDDNGNSTTFVPATYNETVVEPIEKAQLDSKLIGKWEDSAGYGMKYTFNDDNTMIMSSYGANIYGYYSAENDTIKIKYQAAELVENSAQYTFKDDSLVLNDLEFKRVKE